MLKTHSWCESKGHGAPQEPCWVYPGLRWTPSLMHSRTRKHQLFGTRDACGCDPILSPYRWLKRIRAENACHTAGTGRSLLQVLAQYGSSANLSTLPHLEIRFSISISPGNEGLIRSETVNAVNGPLVPLLRASGINATFVQLTDLSLVRTLLHPAPGARLCQDRNGSCMQALHT